jgi:hypothetical protein
VLTRPAPIRVPGSTFANKKQRLDCFNGKTKNSLEKQASLQDTGSVLQQAVTHGEIIVENEIEGGGSVG